MRTPTALGLVTLAVLGLAAPAHSQVIAKDAGCRASIAKAAAKVALSTLKTTNTCSSGVLKGVLPASTDCAAEAAGPSAVACAEALLSRKTSARCDDASNAAVLARYPSCPSPGQTSDDGGTSAGIDSFAEVMSCQAALNTKYAASLGRYLLSGNTRLSAATYRCALAIQKATTKLWKTVNKEHAKCQRDSDLSGGSYDYVCDNVASAKITAIVEKSTTLVVDRCAGVSAPELGRLGSCATTAAGLAACAIDATLNNAGGLTANAYGHAGRCPTGLRIISRAGNADGGRVTATRIDAGWTGLGHDGDSWEGFSARFDLSCSTADCDTCLVIPNCEDGNCRCSNDASVACDTPHAAGGPCGAGTCVVHFGPPRGRSIGGVPACIAERIETTLAGTDDVGSGKVNLAWKNSQHVYLGISQEQPCPVCSGAAVGATGTCNGGARDGLTCKTDGLDPDFGSMSYDCPPAPASDVTAPNGLYFDIALTDEPTSLIAALACDPPLESHFCPCGVCSGDPSIACFDDATCSTVGAGTCGGAAGASRTPNDCEDLVCSPVSSDSNEGVCAAGPIDSFCDGILRANGEGFIPCSMDADCAAFPAGQCSQNRKRDCFLDTISRSGLATPSGGVIGWTGCVPAIQSGYMDTVLGLPGPGRRSLSVRYEHYCADGATLFELGGSVCM